MAAGVETAFMLRSRHHPPLVAVRWLARWQLWLCISLALIGLGVTAGWISGQPSGGAPAPGEGGRTAGVVTAFLYVFVGNLRVVATLILGSCTFGMLAVVVLLWNGYHLGHGLRGLPPDARSLVLIYVPLEFLAVGVAAAASLGLSYRIAMCLLFGASIRVRPLLRILLVSVTLFSAAAALEVFAARVMGVHGQ